MKQLNLFDFEEQFLNEQPEQPVEQSSKSQNHDNINHNIKSALKVDSTLDHHEANLVSQFKLGDQVKIILIAEALDSETHHYRKYYEPHLIGKVGEVTKVMKKKNNQFSYEVNVYGTVSVFEEAELVWIG